MQTTIGRAAAAMEPDMVFTPSGECWGYLEDEGYLVVLHGHFELSSAPIPRGAAAPKGEVRELVINAHTGWQYGLSLSNEQHPAELA